MGNNVYGIFYSPCKLVLFFEEELKLISSIFVDESILDLQ